MQVISPLMPWRQDPLLVSSCNDFCRQGDWALVAIDPLSADHGLVSTRANKRYNSFSDIMHFHYINVRKNIRYLYLLTLKTKITWDWFSGSVRWSYAMSEVNPLRPSQAYNCQGSMSSLVQSVACRLLTTQVINWIDDIPLLIVLETKFNKFE